MLCKGCGKMAMDNSCAKITSEESEHPPLTSCSQIPCLMNRKSGQFICYETGQFYLLLTAPFEISYFRLCGPPTGHILNMNSQVTGLCVGVLRKAPNEKN
jgi:hypothetical protein